MTTHPFSSTPGRTARLIVVALALMLAVAALVGPAASAEVSRDPAATITVDGTTCTLADAITAANTDTATGGCPAGDPAVDTIELTVDVTLTSALPPINAVVTINGNGNTIARDSTAASFRILDVTGSSLLTVNDTTITGGNAFNENGGGIRVASGGSLILSNSVVENNQTSRSGPFVAAGWGGGIYFEGGGLFSISNSTIRNNVAVGNGGGGGVYYDNLHGSSPPVQISGSTFSGNSTTDTFADGGGIRIDGGTTTDPLTVNIENSTFSGNSTNGRGGGIFHQSGAAGLAFVLNVDSSTFAGNTSATSAGVANDGPDIGVNLTGSSATAAQVNLKNTILTGGCGNYFGSNANVYTSQGHNLSSAAADTSCNLTQSTDLTNTDPQLGALANNGGPTETHALLPGSPAIDAGDTNLTTDQRGEPRPAGAADDIGAYEEQNPLAITLASFDAAAQADHVLVTWETVSELQNAGFNLYRTTTADPPTAANLLAFVPSQGPGSTQGFAYSHQDYAVTAGQTYWYWLEDVAFSGATAMHGPVSVVFTAPTAVTLSGLDASSPAPLAGLWWLAAVAAALAAAAAVVWRRRTTI